MIKVSNLLYQYKGTDKQIRFPDFEVPTGETSLLLGESGSGKTTLLHLIGGLLRSQVGNILIADSDITQLNESALDRFRAKHIGFIFQRNHLINALSVKKNVAMAPYLAGEKSIDPRIEEVLLQLGLADKQHAKINQLSVGQAQRVAIARAMVNKPNLILADEPTSALDDTNCERVIHLLMDLAKKNNATLLVATHDQRLKSIIPKQIVLPQISST
ncbi:MAG: ABC transporter ATP-binding protein [Flammeovirgaceae bacterium]